VALLPDRHVLAEAQTYLGFTRLAHDHDHCALSFLTAVGVEYFSTFILQQYPVVFRHKKQQQKSNI